MGLRIIYGKPGSGKSQFCFQEIVDQIQKEKKIYMITPEQFSFTAEEKLMETIKTHAVINVKLCYDKNFAILKALVFTFISAFSF